MYTYQLLATGLGYLLPGCYAVYFSFSFLPFVNLYFILYMVPAAETLNVRDGVPAVSNCKPERYLSIIHTQTRTLTITLMYP